MWLSTAKRWLLYLHRWLGMACCVVFALWFVSGVVMMYARMPELTAGERLLRLPPLDTAAFAVRPDQAARRAGFTASAPPDRLRLSTALGRPAYRFARGERWQAVFADTGEPIARLTVNEALAVARMFAPEHGLTARYDRRLEDSDQWTLSAVVRAQMPLHRIALGDEAGTDVYVADRSAEVVMKTDRRSRTWAYVGAVLHWVYITPLRRHTDLWRNVIIGLSLAGCVVCLSGLVTGVWRWSRRPRFRLRGHPAPARSPYTGAMRWHHYAGLGFGLVTFTWVLSGLLSMNPGGWSPGNSPAAAQRLAMAGGWLALGDLHLDGLSRAATRIRDGGLIKEIHVLQFQGMPYYAADRFGGAPDHRQWATTDLARYLADQAAPPRRMVPASAPESDVFTAFARADVERATRRALPGAHVVESRWLDDYDAYYYDRRRVRPLPVLRVKFDDEARTWLYADPASGAIVASYQQRSRLERWLYHGLHSLDFPWLHDARPAWDIIVIGLSVGGTVLSTSAVLLAGRRGRRWARRALPRPGR